VADREEIAKRHGIGHLADKLVGETDAELEADAAARASIIAMFTPRELDVPPPPEPPVEGLPAKDKPIADYTDEERAAVHADLDRTLRTQAKQQEREQREEAERSEAEANRTPEQEHADTIIAALHPDAKRARDAALVRSLLGEDGSQ
jgi:hypothetical protein